MARLCGIQHIDSRAATQRRSQSRWLPGSFASEHCSVGLPACHRTACICSFSALLLDCMVVLALSSNDRTHLQVFYPHLHGTRDVMLPRPQEPPVRVLVCEAQQLRGQSAVGHAAPALQRQDWRLSQPLTMWLLHSIACSGWMTAPHAAQGIIQRMRVDQCSAATREASSHAPKPSTRALHSLSCFRNSVSRSSCKHALQDPHHG